MFVHSEFFSFSALPLSHLASRQQYLHIIAIIAIIAIVAMFDKMLFQCCAPNNTRSIHAVCRQIHIFLNVGNGTLT